DAVVLFSELSDASSSFSSLTAFSDSDEEELSSSSLPSAIAFVAFLFPALHAGQELVRGSGTGMVSPSPAQEPPTTEPKAFASVSDTDVSSPAAFASS